MPRPVSQLPGRGLSPPQKHRVRCCNCLAMIFFFAWESMGNAACACSDPRPGYDKPPDPHAISRSCSSSSGDSSHVLDPASLGAPLPLPDRCDEAAAGVHVQPMFCNHQCRIPRAVILLSYAAELLHYSLLVLPLKIACAQMRMCKMCS